MTICLLFDCLSLLSLSVCNRANKPNAALLQNAGYLIIEHTATVVDLTLFFFVTRTTYPQWELVHIVFYPTDNVQRVVIAVQPTQFASSSVSFCRYCFVQVNRLRAQVRLCIDEIGREKKKHNHVTGSLFFFCYLNQDFVSRRVRYRITMALHIADYLLRATLGTERGGKNP